MYSVEYSAKSRKILKKLPNSVSGRIIDKINTIKLDPFKEVIKLQGTKLWRLRVNDYRIVMDIIIKGKTIIVLRVRHRKNVYKKL